MTNFRKSFNFRHGVQVDDDNLIVNSNGLVGIGTTVPTSALDVRGTLKVVGIATIQEAFIGLVTVTDRLDIGSISLSSGIITAKTGIVTYYGDARYLQGMPTSQWVDTDVGLGYTSIYAAGNVGVGTTDPRFSFQVGGNNNVSNFSRGVGISSLGDVTIAGIATITKIYGWGIGVTGLNAGDAIVTGTLSNDRLPSNINKPTGIVTVSSINASGNINASSFIGPVTGTASTAQSLTGTPDIVVGIVTATKIIADTIEVPNTGITTIAELLHVGTDGTAFTALSSGRIGVGTALPTSEIQVRKASGSLVEVVSDSGQARISVGQSVGAGNSSAVLRFGNSAGVLDIVNNDVGDVKTIIHNGTGAGSTGNFKWVYGQTNDELMTLTYDGNLGINNTSPSQRLSVGGGVTVTGSVHIDNNLTVDGNITGTINYPSVITGTNLNNTGGITTLSQLKVTEGVDFDSIPFIGIQTYIGIGAIVPDSYGTSPVGLTVKNTISTNQIVVDDLVSMPTGIITAATVSANFNSSNSNDSAVSITVLTSPDRLLFQVVGTALTATLNLS